MRLEQHVRDLEDVLRQHGITPPRWPPLTIAGAGPAWRARRPGHRGRRGFPGQSGAPGSRGPQGPPGQAGPKAEKHRDSPRAWAHIAWLCDRGCPLARPEWVAHAAGCRSSGRHAPAPACSAQHTSLGGASVGCSRSVGQRTRPRSRGDGRGFGLIRLPCAGVGQMLTMLVLSTSNRSVLLHRVAAVEVLGMSINALVAVLQVQATITTEQLASWWSGSAGVETTAERAELLGRFTGIMNQPAQAESCMASR